MIIVLFLIVVSVLSILILAHYCMQEVISEAEYCEDTKILLVTYRTRIGSNSTTRKYYKEGDEWYTYPQFGMCNDETKKELSRLYTHKISISST